MSFGIFVFYFIIFVVLFVSSRKKGERINYKVVLIIPALLAFFLFLLSVVKIYFIYKILIVIVTLILILLTYWQWGEQIYRWFKK